MGEKQNAEVISERFLSPENLPTELETSEKQTYNRVQMDGQVPARE